MTTLKSRVTLVPPPPGKWGVLVTTFSFLNGEEGRWLAKSAGGPAIFFETVEEARAESAFQASGGVSFRAKRSY